MTNFLFPSLGPYCTWGFLVLYIFRGLVGMYMPDFQILLYNWLYRRGRQLLLAKVKNAYGRINDQMIFSGHFGFLIFTDLYGFITDILITL